MRDSNIVVELALLRGAEDYLEEYGWCQGSLRNVEGEYCLLGALNASVNRHLYAERSFEQSDVRQAANNLVRGLATRCGGPALSLWNDCLLYTSPSPRDRTRSRMPSSA